MPSVDDPSDAPEQQAPSYVATFDPDAGERASRAVVTAIASLVDEDPGDLAPLYEAVDPDALDALVEHARRVDAAGAQTLEFTYEGFDVGVRTDGLIRIAEPGTASSSA